MKNEAIQTKFRKEAEPSKVAMTLVYSNLERITKKTLWERVQSLFRKSTMTLEDWERIESHKYRQTNNGKFDFPKRGSF